MGWGVGERKRADQALRSNSGASGGQTWTGPVYAELGAVD